MVSEYTTVAYNKNILSLQVAAQSKAAAARLLGLWVQTQLGAWLSPASVVCCQVEVSVLG
jgi:hypothetical protein